MEQDRLPPLYAQLLTELARRDDPTPIAELPERLREDAVLSGCESRGLAVGVVRDEGSPGSSGVLAGGTPYVAVGVSPGWYPSARLTHRPPSTHFALTARGKEWLEEEQLRTGPHGSDLLQDAVAALLRRIPERWAEYGADALTATESQALFLLVAAGMVERRIRLRARLHNHPVAVEATITATGEYGFVEAMEPVLATMWAEWKDAYNAWRTGETRGAPLSITEHLQPDEWRLTDQGPLARADLDGDNPHVALDFVLRRGFFDGQPKLILEPGCEPVSQRESVRGYGQLVTMRKVQADAASPAAVNVGNWKEGADAFAAAFQAVAKNEGGNGKPADSEARDAAPAPTPKRKKPRGRKPQTDPKEDERIAEAYERGDYARNADCDRELGLPVGTTYAARERHRKRMSRRK